MYLDNLTCNGATNIVRNMSNQEGFQVMEVDNLWCMVSWNKVRIQIIKVLLCYHATSTVTYVCTNSQIIHR